MAVFSIHQWLDWIRKQHPLEVDMTLARVKTVIKRLKLSQPVCPVFTVGGTNGKGSCVATLEQLYRNAGYRVGAFTSPVLFQHNEYIRINQRVATDTMFCEAFTRIEAARQTVPLTFFEYNTLAAFILFNDAQLDVWLLEVGLGGRLDAVNCLAATVAIITSIAIDHAERLGTTREEIAREKAGILRPHTPAVCGDPCVPKALQVQARKLQAPLYCQGQEFGYRCIDDATWSWWSQEAHYPVLPNPQLTHQNIATALMAAHLMQKTLPFTQQHLLSAIQTAILPARLQVITGTITQVFDVAHNPAAAALLAVFLQRLKGRIVAVFSMLREKDCIKTLQAMQAVVSQWYVAELATPRATPLAVLQANFSSVAISAVNFYPSIDVAYRAAMQQAQPGDCVVAFGSFHVISELKAFMPSLVAIN